MDLLLNLKNDQIGVIVENNKEKRKLLHMYFSKYHPKLYKTSLKCNLFDVQLFLSITKCSTCNKKIIVKNNDNDDSDGSFLENYVENYNSDCENGYCDRCEEFDSYDYTDLRHIYHNNIIAFGNYFKNYQKNNHNKQNQNNNNFENQYFDTEVYFEDVFNSGKLYVIDKPKTKNKSEQLKKQSVEKYITREIKFQIIKSYKMTYLSYEYLPNDIINLIKFYN